MERMTCRDARGELWYAGGTEANHLHRLAAYEDTGVTPEEMARAIVLPFKMSDTIYYPLFGKVEELPVSRIDYMRDGDRTYWDVAAFYANGSSRLFGSDDFGVTFFRTRAEAEAALAKEGRHMIAGDDFKRCPFCGGEAVIIKTYNGRWETGCSEIGCIANSCVATYKTEKDAREAWNKRATE